MKKTNGFTLFEVLIGLSILGIITAIAVPNLTQFLVNTRVDNEISQLQRLLLVARNTAINAEQTVTVCPLSASLSCTNNWQNQLTVFIDVDGDGNLETGSNDKIVKVKESISNGDRLQFSRNSVIYTPSGRLSGFSNGTFSYCPAEQSNLSRGIILFRSGRAYLSSDTNRDGIEEDRNGNEITCS